MEEKRMNARLSFPDKPEIVEEIKSALTGINVDIAFYHEEDNLAQKPSLFIYDGMVCTEEDNEIGICSIFIATEKTHVNNPNTITSHVALCATLDVVKPLKLDFELNNHDRDCCRAATFEESKLLFAEIYRSGYVWDDYKRKLVKSNKWVPNNDERYFFPLADSYKYNTFTVGYNEWTNDIEDKTLFKKGWVFRTGQEAQALCDKLNKLVMV